MTSAKLLFAIFVVVCACTPAYAATKYVDNSGTPPCSNSTSFGSESQPFCTITYGVAHIAGGDTLYVKNGTYPGAFTITGPSGTPGAHTIISAYPGHAPVINGPGFSGGRIKISHGCSYIDFIGFTITNHNQGLYLDDDVGTSTPCDHVTVDRVTVHDVGQEGIALRGGTAVGPRNFVVKNSVVYRTARLGPSYNGEGIYVGSKSDTTNGVTLLNNVVHDVQDECIELKGDSHDIIVDGNELYNCMSPGSSYSNVSGAIEMDEPLNSTTNPNQIIRNNIVHDLAFTSGITKYGIRAGTGATIYNNILYSINSAYSCIYSNTSNYPRLIYHNTIDCATTNAVVNAGTTIDNRNNIGPTGTNNLPFSASYFVNASGHNYHLVAGQPPVDAGAPLFSVVPVDIEGNSRQTGSAPDLGAYELAANAPSPPTNVRIVN